MEKKKVMIGMSGGVDSSVAAGVLLEKGYDVYGVTLKLWDDEEDVAHHAKVCCSLSDIEDARAVADKLGIPYYVLNFKGNFKEKVVDYFVNSYLGGETPNPCIACNRHIKFNGMLFKAMGMGMDYVATGHYCSIDFDAERGRYVLKKSQDQTKDQSYVLYNMTQEQLKMTLMPLGGYTKQRVRELAVEMGLKTAKKPDSQEICFVPDNNYSGFIRRHSNQEIAVGDFTDTQGNVIGRHKGITDYTVGQRKGLGLAVGKPLYVVAKDLAANKVVLGDEKALYTKTFVVKDLNYIAIPELKGEMRVTAKTRHTMKETAAIITPMENGDVRVEFDTPQKAITPGQSAVFYEAEVVVAGGIIREKIN